MAITIADVKLVYPSAAGLEDAQIQAAIDLANLIVAENLVDCDYSDTMQDAIAKYLAAHFLSISEDQGGLKRKKTGESEEQYRELSLETQGLSLTVYGQQALALDTQGCLGALATKSQKAQFRVV